MTVWYAGHKETVPFWPPYQTVIYIVTNTRCRIGTVYSPDDGHVVAQNM